jgi:hypothetical protein
MYVSNLKAGDLYKAELVLAAIHCGDWSWLRLLRPNEGRLTQECLMVDSDDNQYDPRAAQNENTPKDILAKLAEVPQDLWDKILDKMPEAQDIGIANIRAKIAHNPNTPKETLRKLSEEDENNHLLIASLARNPSAPREVLLKIKKANRGMASEYAARNLEG